jgi:hypothetical protein
MPIRLITLKFNFAIGAEWAIAMESYTPRLRELRKLANQALNPRFIRKEYADILEQGARKLVKCLLEDPDKFSENIHL